MPFSGNDFVKETVDYINLNYPHYKKILDIGAGAGKFGTKLYNYVVDAIEVHEPYVNKFKLHDIYNDVFNINCLDFKGFDDYDLVIMWKTLEHLSFLEARVLINLIKKSKSDFIFAIPFELKQGVCHDNIFEIHEQDDLTQAIVKRRYPEFDILFESENHGVYKLRK